LLCVSLISLIKDASVLNRLALLDVVLEAFLSFLCMSSPASDFAFLYSSVVFFAFDVVDLEGVILFGVVSLFCVGFLYFFKT
jgi:hypothetical protein